MSKSILYIPFSGSDSISLSASAAFMDAAAGKRRSLASEWDGHSASKWVTVGQYSHRSTALGLFSADTHGSSECVPCVVCRGLFRFVGVFDGLMAIL